MTQSELGKRIYIALIGNPERYKYIAEQIESGKLTQKQATDKNIHKAKKLAAQWFNN